MTFLLVKAMKIILVEKTSHTSEDKNVGDISGIPVMVEEVTADLSPRIPLLTKVVQFLQEEPNAESVAQSNNEVT